MDKIWLRQYPQGVPAEIQADEHASLAQILERSYARFATLRAYSNMGGSLSYRELDSASSAFAAYLQKVLRLAKGDRVAIMLPNVLQYPVVLCGLLRAGMTAVNVNPMYTPREAAHQLSDSGAHGGVLEAAAIAVDDPRSEQAVKVFVVRKDPLLTEATLLAHFRKNLTGYKVPKLIAFRTEPLPKSNIGKILRRELREPSAAYLACCAPEVLPARVTPVLHRTAAAFGGSPKQNYDTRASRGRRLTGAALGAISPPRPHDVRPSPDRTTTGRGSRCRG